MKKTFFLYFIRDGRTYFSLILFILPEEIIIGNFYKQLPKTDEPLPVETFAQSISCRNNAP
jgi:hypothetical protein